jgi:hypothetical protein
MAFGVVGLVFLVGGGVLANTFLISPLTQRAKRIAALEKSTEETTDQINRILADKPKLERWRQLSLPADQVMARGEYAKFLTDLMRQSSFAVEYLRAGQSDGRVNVTADKKKPVYTPLTYSLRAKASLGNVVKMLEKFYNTGLMHRISHLIIERTDGNARGDTVTVQMTVEALILSGAEDRSKLLGAPDKSVALSAVTAMRRGPAALALVPWAVGPTGPLGPRALSQPPKPAKPGTVVASYKPRKYDDIARKNIFVGEQTRQERSADPYREAILEYAELTDITRNGVDYQAFITEKDKKEKKTRLRAKNGKPLGGFDSFHVKDISGESVLQGKVVWIGERDLIFKSDDKYYSLHFGQNLATALEKGRLSESQVKSMMSAAVLGSVQLTEISRTEGYIETFLDDKASDRKTRLRANKEGKPLGGFDSFQLKDGSGEVVLRGKVMWVSEQHVIFQADNKFYTIRPGQSLAEAVAKNQLSETEAKALLASKPDK